MANRKKKDSNNNLSSSGISLRDSQSLERYLQDISKVPLITAADEVTLAREIQAGNQDALEKLVKSNLRFVVSVAKQYQNQGLTLTDLINEGNIGLIKAAKRFDETRGFKFISYAVWWIKQSILQALAENSRTVRLPLNKIGEISKINKEYSKLEQILNREPTPAELGEALEMSAGDVSNLKKYSAGDVSMNSPFSQGEEGTLLDVMPDKEIPNPDNTLMDDSLKLEIERALSKLTEREADVLRYYFGIGRENPATLEEIGERFDLTRERVRQIKEKALRKMRHHNRTLVLKTYI